MRAFRSITSILPSAPRGRVGPVAWFAAVALALALGLAISAVLPSARAEEIACPPPGGNLWHFQNYTHSGKKLTLDGYTGTNGTGSIMITCGLHIPEASTTRSRGGEIWMPYDVQSVKITSWSDNGGDPVTLGPLDNKENTCFRIVRNDHGTSWEFYQRAGGDKCTTE